LLALLAEPCLLPALRIAFDDKGAAILAELVGVADVKAVLVLAEGEGQTMEEPRGAVPDVMVFVGQEGRLEPRRETLADRAPDAVRPHQEIGGREILHPLDRGLEAQIDPEIQAAFLKNMEEVDSREARETVAADRHLLPAVDDVDVVPPFEEGVDRLE